MGILKSFSPHRKSETAKASINHRESETEVSPFPVCLSPEADDQSSTLRPVNMEEVGKCGLVDNHGFLKGY